MKLASFATAFALAASIGSAQSAPITYSGLQTGLTAGTVAAESGPFGSADNWTFYRFHTSFLKEVTITLTPTSPELDVVFAVFYGTEADSDDYSGLFSGGLSSVLVDAADGVDPFNTGPGQAASLSFVNIFGSSPFVLAVADWADGLGAGQLGYTIDARIPEAQTLALMLAGIGGFALSRRRKV